MKILVIESDPWLGDHYQRVIEEQQFAVVRASNAYAAMDVIDDVLPAAIIMSLSLSGGSGIALLHELQTYIDTGQIPVIVCSNMPHFSDKELQPYGVRRIIDSTTMLPSDLVTAIRSVTAQ